MNIIECKYCDTDTPHTEDYYYKRNDNTEYFLLMFFKTSFIYKKDGKICNGQKYTYLLNAPNSEAEHGSLNETFVNDWIFFKGTEASKIITEFNLPINTPFYIDKHSIIYPYIKKISIEQTLKPTCYKHKISGLLSEMLIKLGRQYEIFRMDTHPAFRAINQTRNYMLANVEYKFTLKKLSEYANYSESRFSILYKRFYKSSPIEDLLTARIEKAENLLNYSSYSITEIASLCGFSSIHHFSKTFKERTGVSPSEFTQKHFSYHQ